MNSYSTLLRRLQGFLYGLGEAKDTDERPLLPDSTYLATKGLIQEIQKALDAEASNEVSLEKFRELLAQELFYKKFAPSNDALAYKLRGDNTPFDSCESKDEFYAEADVLLELTRKPRM